MIITAWGSDRTAALVILIFGSFWTLGSILILLVFPSVYRAIAEFFIEMDPLVLRVIGVLGTGLGVVFICLGFWTFWYHEEIWIEMGKTQTVTTAIKLPAWIAKDGLATCLCARPSASEKLPSRIEVWSSVKIHNMTNYLDLNVKRNLSRSLKDMLTRRDGSRLPPR